MVLGDRVLRGRLEWWLAALTALTVVALTNVRARAIPDPAHPEEHRSDFTVYTEAGGWMLRGVDPYQVAGPESRKRYTYPPLLALLVAPLDRLERPWAVVVWFYLSAALAYGMILEGLRLWRATGAVGPPWLPAVAILGVACPLGLGVQLGQVDTLLGYFLMLGLRVSALARSRRAAALGGAILALPVAIKLIPLVPVAVLLGALLFCGWRRAAASAAGLLAGLVTLTWLLPAAALGWDQNQELLDTWRHEVLGDRNLIQPVPLYSQDNASLSAALVGAGRWMSGSFDTFAGEADSYDGPLAHLGPEVVSGAAPTIARAAVVVLLLVGGLGYARLRNPLALAAAFGVGVAAMLLVTPLTWSHYYTMFLPGLLFVPGLAFRAGQTRAGWWLAVGPAALLLADDLLSPQARWLHLLPFGMALWYLAACLLPWRLRAGDLADGVGAHRTVC